ncbi:MAG: peptidylprolyl isomerase [Chitinophagales bacterium]|nr:peptidylprolyl isomerase [Chitinophagales bacterium]MCZ2392355.1 peptidylprolyl isomerase [Chitinophagales bacterium]
MKKIILLAIFAHFVLTMHGQETSKQQKNTETMVIISTSFGDMKVKLYDETPQHRDNFIKLVNESYYDGLLFHRVIQQFMIQGGDPNSRNAQAGQSLGSGGPGYTVPAEFNPSLIHKKGALSAARLGDQMNPKKASSGSQFYIVQGKPISAQELQYLSMRTGVQYTPEQAAIYATEGGTPFLDMQYTVFGEVVEGLEVIDKIAAVKTAPGDRPIEDVKFTVKLLK